MTPESTGPPPTVQALIAALADRPDASAAELAETAGMGRSTATRLLAALAGQGRVLRRPGGYHDGRRIPDRWTLIATTTGIATTSPAAPDAAPTSPASPGRPRSVTAGDGPAPGR